MNTTNLDLPIREGGEAYIRYCAGISVLQSPADWTDAHLSENLNDMTAEKAGNIIAYGERLMMSGVKRFIEATLPPGQKIHEARFTDDTEISMLTMLDDVFEVPKYLARIERINKRYSILRPAPFLRHAIFTDITHAKYSRLRTIDLLDEGYEPNEMLEPWISERTVKSPRAHAQGRTDLITE